MTGDDWFEAWAKAHYSRHKANARVPDPTRDGGEGWYRTIQRLFAARGIGREAAEKASVQLFVEPPKTAADHVPALLRLAAAEAGKHDAGGAADTRETATEASRDCPRCGATGLATVWRPEPAYELRRAPSVAAYCVCRLGRWIKRRHQSTTPDLLNLVPDLHDALAHRGEWLAERPEGPPARPYVLPEHVPPSAPARRRGAQ